MSWQLRLLFGILLVTFVMLQYRLWVGQGSLAEVALLKRQISRQELRLEEMRERNSVLRAEVNSLKHGLEAVEARARSELGMIKEGETFYQIVPPDKANPHQESEK
jgi:cell division protein FtsB